MVETSRPSRKSAGVLFVPPTDEEAGLDELAQQVPVDHLARQIADAVNCLDLSEFLASYRGQGSLPYRPDILLRVVLFETRRGVRSPAQWWRDATESVPVRWLLQGYMPSRSVWYAFRDRLAPWLEGFNEQVITQALDRGITAAARGALDGTLIAANASRHRLLNEATLQKRSEQLEQVVAADRQQQVPTAMPGWMAPTVSGRLEQQGRYHQAQERMRALQERNQHKRSCKRTPADKIVVSVSDPAAALGRDKEKVYRPLYNVQLVDDLDSPLILNYGVFAQPNDNGTLEPMLERQAQLTGRKPLTLLADASYANGADLAVSKAAGVLLLAPYQQNDFTADKAKKKELAQLPKKEFTWLAEEQTYRCPQGHRLDYVGSSQQKRSSTETVRVQIYRCAPEHCCACPLSQQCAPNPKVGRTISRGEHEDLIETLRERMQTAEAKALYRLRRQTVELVNADFKEHRKIRRFSGRGLKRAEAEIGLLVLVNNLLVCQEHTSAAAKEDGRCPQKLAA
ncbi:MAG TPA: IS1182 family transposase [Gemmataceae bacterium]|jgi:transposase|nr:IS1182 family transposase [Gemmataceae bacterium]